MTSNELARQIVHFTMTMMLADRRTTYPEQALEFMRTWEAGVYELCRKAATESQDGKGTTK